jgi:rod shape-determining protein MreB
VTAERIKHKLGTALAPSSGDTKMMRIRGRHLSAGMPKEIAISDVEVAEAIHESVSQIVGAVRSALESTPPELSADIIDRGIILTGGGAMLQRMDEALSLATGLPVAVAEDPLNCVALGAGRALEDADYRGVLAEA